MRLCVLVSALLIGLPAVAGQGMQMSAEEEEMMEAMGIKDKALVDAGPMLQVRGLKRRAKERYTFAPLRPCAL